MQQFSELLAALFGLIQTRTGFDFVARMIGTASDDGFGDIVQERPAQIQNTETVQQVKQTIEEDLNNQETVDTTIKVVIFSLDKELFGLEINKIKEIIKIPEYHLHNSSEYIEGIINFRGKITRDRPKVGCRIETSGAPESATKNGKARTKMPAC